MNSLQNSQPKTHYEMYCAKWPQSWLLKDFSRKWCSDLAAMIRDDTDDDTRMICVLYAYYTRIPPDPMNHVQICKGQPHWFALWEPVPHWYKTFLPDHIDLAEMKNPAGLSKRISTAYSCAEDQILENKSSEQSFKYLYWTISKTLFWNMFTRKWT